MRRQFFGSVRLPGRPLRVLGPAILMTFGAIVAMGSCGSGSGSGDGDDTTVPTTVGAKNEPGGLPTDDVRRLVALAEDPSSGLVPLGFEMTGPDATDGPSDFSYLSDADRADTDTMANVRATTETNELIAWFGRDEEGWIGLWLGPDETPVERAPVVRLDTEGQYEIVGSTVGDFLAATTSGYDDDVFVEQREKLAAKGFDVAASLDAFEARIDALGVADPNDHRDELFERYR